MFELVPSCFHHVVQVSLHSWKIGGGGGGIAADGRLVGNGVGGLEAADGLKLVLGVGKTGAAGGWELGFGVENRKMCGEGGGGMLYFCLD